MSFRTCHLVRSRLRYVSLERRHDRVVTKVGRYTNNKRINPYPAKVIYLNFQPLEVVSRYRDLQLQGAENYSYTFNLTTNIFKSFCLDTRIISNNSNLVN